MSARMRFVVVGALCLGGLAPRAGEAQEETNPMMAVELIGVYQKMLDAIRTRDSIALRSLLTEQYVFTAGTPGVAGMVRDRERRIREMLESDARIEELRVDGCSIRFYAGSAVGACEVESAGTYRSADGRHESGRWTVYSTVVYVREQGGPWRIAATHTTLGPKRNEGGGR